MARPRKTAPAKNDSYKVSVAIGNNIIIGTGNTALEALVNLPRPAKVMNKTVLTATHGEKRTELLMMPARAKRIFYQFAQPFLAKHLEMLLK